MNRENIDSCYIPAAKRALESFPVEADKIEFVTQSENVTFRVSVDADDTDYVLRFHRPGYNSIKELESERAWIADLKKAGCFDGACGEWEKAVRYLMPMQSQLSSPVLLLGIEAPAFKIIDDGRGENPRTSIEWHSDSNQGSLFEF